MSESTRDQQVEEKESKKEGEDKVRTKIIKRERKGERRERERKRKKRKVKYLRSQHCIISEGIFTQPYFILFSLCIKKRTHYFQGHFSLRGKRYAAKITLKEVTSHEVLKCFS